MNKTARLETFSDGVFAIAATLLILEVKLPGHGSVAHDLVHAWPSYVAYAISFINVVFLMTVAFSPFPTRIVAEHLREGSKSAAFAYGLTFTMMAISYGAMWFYAAIGRRLIAESADQRVISGISRSFAPGWVIYGAATLSSFISAYLAVALYAVIALFYVLESSIFGRDEVSDPLVGRSSAS
jgi:uncharacterized membrane protein